MTKPPSTVKSADDATVTSTRNGRQQLVVGQSITTHWAKSGRPDLVAAIEENPEILTNKALLLSLALDEYERLRRVVGEFDLEEHCGRFQQFGSDLAKSVFRRLQTKAYLDNHPELLDLFREPDWPGVGESFGPFQVLEEIGSGSHSRVFLCREPEVGGRHVAVKVTPFSDCEASILGRLQHENIMPIYSTGTISERRINYICMPFRGRSTLVDLIDLAGQRPGEATGDLVVAAARRWLRPDDSLLRPSDRAQRAWGRTTLVGAIIDLGVQLATALAHAHDRNVLHGDLKPSNVLLTPDGTPLLLDFNLSMDAATTFAPRGGTLPYMPPEHVRIVAADGEPADVDGAFDTRSDIYSFAAMIYELLTGSPPFDVELGAGDRESIAADLLRQQRAGARSTRGRNPLVSRELDELLLGCLSWDPAQRPRSMREVARVLQRQQRLASELVRHARLRPLVAASLIGAVLVAGALAAGAWLTAPPRSLVEFEQGMAQYEAGNYDAALDHFNEALEDDPDNTEAQFQKALVALKRGEIEVAGAAFGTLARDTGDARSLAYTAYCYNLCEFPAVAVPWYEQALDAGAHGASVLNNLGASLLITSPRGSLAESVDSAIAYFREALDLRPESTMVQFNLLRAEWKKCTLDKSYMPSSAAQLVAKLSRTLEDNLDVQLAAARLWARLGQDNPQLLEKGVQALKRAASLGYIGSEASLTRRDDFHVYRSHAEFPAILELVRANQTGQRPQPMAAFLEPSDL